jgi:hypothetical protein
LFRHFGMQEGSRMGRMVVAQVEIGGFIVEMGEPISKDGGLVVVAQRIRASQWFQPLVEGLLAAMARSPKQAHGFDRRPKLEAGLLALIAGLVMGRRNPWKASLENDPLASNVLTPRPPRRGHGGIP